MKRGFTLVELMIVVAIVMVLAAIAIPQFVKYQLTAKRSEVQMNVEGMVVASRAYTSAFDRLPTLLGMDYCDDPSVYLPRRLNQLDKKAVVWITNSVFTTINWKPDGVVRGGYCIHPTGGQGYSDSMWVAGLIDADDDGYLFWWAGDATQKDLLNVPRGRCVADDLVSPGPTYPDCY